MKRVILVLVIFTSVLAGAVSQQVRFGELNLSASGELLFTATTEMPGLGQYTTTFFADIPTASMQQLTVFPERMHVVRSSGVIQIQNRYGLFRTPEAQGASVSFDQSTTDATGNTGADGAAAKQAAENPYTPPRPEMALQPVAHFSAFVRGNDIQTGKIVAVDTSPDGRYLTYLVPTSAGYADLRMYDMVLKQETTISSRVELTLDRAPLKWSGNSRLFVYSRRNELYYYSLDQYRNGRVLTESLRRLGSGMIGNVSWDDDDTLYYVRGSLVYQIRGTEFFTRSLYQELLKIGTIVGKLPDAFDPNFDRFWISPDGKKILLSKDGRNLMVLLMEADDYLGVAGSSSSPGGAVVLPHLYLPRNTRVQTVLWSPSDRITVLAGSIRRGETTTAVFRLDLGGAGEQGNFQQTDDEGVIGIALSPDRTRVLVWTDDSAHIKDYATWETVITISHGQLLHGAWHGNTRLVLGGRNRIERIDLNAMERARTDTAKADARTLVAFSSVDESGYAPENTAIRVRSGNDAFELNETGWTPIEEYEVIPARVAGEEHRVYLENVSRGSYANMVMVRSITTYGTTPLFPRPRRQFEPFPEREQSVDMTNFAHGSRIRRREVALVFNAVDSVAGLTEILNTLMEYDIRATFFLNGDFIRRHPGAVREIAESGHEVGNLFFTHFDFADSQFQIDTEFVKQGLARNEDEFFDVTGRELSLLWHAPYYFVNPVIIAASREMNYAYIGRDVDSLDWIPLRDENGISRLYKPAADIVESVLQQKKPGSIISLTVGRPGDDRPDGGREDYLFHRLDVLINGLIERGYDTVTVSTLMDNAR